VISNGRGGSARTLFLREGEVGRIVGPSRPVKLRAVRSADPIENNAAVRKVLGDLIER
jgi:hypothetical protein